jgi:hypothetical protein
LVKNIGKGAVNDSNIYSYCTAYCIVTGFSFDGKPSSKIRTQKMPTHKRVNCAILAF